MAEPATVACPACGKGYRLRDELAGRKVRCGACDAVLLLPAQPGYPAVLVKAEAKPRAASATNGKERVSRSTSASASAAASASASASTSAASPAAGGVRVAATPGASDGYEIDLPDPPDPPPAVPAQSNTPADAEADAYPVAMDDLPSEPGPRPGSILFQGRGDKNFDDLHADPAGDVYIPAVLAGLGVIALLVFVAVFRPTPEASLLEALLAATFTVLLAAPALGLGVVLVMLAFASPLDPLPLSFRKLGALSLFMCGLDLLVWAFFNRVNEGLNESGLALQYSIPLQVFISLSLWFGLTRRLTECEIFDTLALWLFARVAPAVAGVLVANWVLAQMG